MIGRWVAVVVLAVSGALVGVTPVEAACAAQVQSDGEAAALARRCHSRIEVMSKRTENTQTWANPDGTRSTGMTFGPARVQRDGKWVDVDLNLERKPNGSVGPKMHPLDLSVGNGGELATIVTNGQRVGFGWQGKLPEPRLEGTKATYPNVRPGVDLVVESIRSGFEYFFIVHDRQAATYVTELAMPMRLGTSVTVADPDGSIAIAPAGKPGSAKQLAASRDVVAFMPTPYMWDATVDPVTGEHQRTKRIGSKVRGTDLVLNPDMSFLMGQDVTYPITLDPAVAWAKNGGFFDTWVQNTYQNTDNQYSTELKFGRHTSTSDGEIHARSYLQFDSSAFKGTKIHSANLRLWAHHSWSCTAASWTAEITNGISASTRWGSQPGWHGVNSRSSSTQTTGWGGSCPDGFINMDVKTTMQYLANLWSNQGTIGLRGATETNELEWKRVNSSDNSNPPYLEIHYNHVPSTPWGVQLAGEERCAAGAGVRQYVSDQDPLITAVSNDSDSNNGSDADAQLLRTRLQINNSAGTALWSQDDDVAITDGQRAFFDDLDNPSTTGVNETLAPGVYGYQLATSDTVDWSNWTGNCEFEVVTDIPDSYPVVTKGTKVNGLTPVTFAPAAGDETEVAGYRFGLAQDKLASYVAAGPGGIATIQLANEGNFTQKLFVRAVNKTNAPGPLDTVGTTVGGGATANRVASDVNGDGRADVVGMTEVSAGRVQPYVLFNNATGGFTEPVHQLHGDVMGSYSASVTLHATGDFDADGRTDLAVLTDDGGVKLKILRSNGIGFIDQNITWAPPSGTTIAKSRFFAADFDGDGKDDVAIIRESAYLEWQAWVWRSTSSGIGSVTFDSPSSPWYTNPAGWADWNRTKYLVGKFVGNDSRADIAGFYDYGNAHTKLWTHKNLASNVFEGGVQQWDGGVNNADWWKSDYVTADYTGDGRTDIINRYDYGGCQSRLWSFVPNASDAVIGAYPNFDSGPVSWCSDLMELRGGDYNADGKGDVGVVYHCCGQSQKKAWTFSSTGSTLSAPTVGWEGGLGLLNVGDTKYDPAKRYELVNVNSGKCVIVPGGTTANATQLVQETCNSTQLHKTFTITRDGAAQQVLRPAHNTGMCVDVNGQGTADGTIIWQYTCNAGAAQRWQIQYRWGASGSDPVVRIVLVQTGMCLDVASSGTADGVQIWEWTCNNGNAQNFYLRQVP